MPLHRAVYTLVSLLIPATLAEIRPGPRRSARAPETGGAAAEGVTFQGFSSVSDLLLSGAVEYGTKCFCLSL